jgi:ABC-type Fe3+ transport system substrate-binding protein
VYPAAVVTASANPGAAERLIQFLGGPDARRAFQAAGFTLP